MKKLTASLSIIIFISLFSGCSFKIEQIDSLMRPPLVLGDYHQLQEVFYKSVGKDIILKSPQSGEYRSAFVLYDIDNDGENEALAFYIKKQDKTTARMHILDKIGGSWYSAGDFTGFGSEIETVSFVNMNNDMLNEIIVSWRLYDNNINRYIAIYGCIKNNQEIEVKALSTELFTLMLPVDIDNDLETEIFLVYLDKGSEKPEAYAKVLKMLDNGLIDLASQINLDSNIIGYTKIESDKAPGGYPVRIYIDANKGETQMITEAVYWNAESKSLVSPLLDVQAQPNNITLRNNRIYSMDINNDGIIEIPTQEVLPGAKTFQSDNNKTAPIYLTKWIQIMKDGNMVEILRSVVNFADGYMITLPKDVAGRITILSFSDNSRWDICLYDKSENTAEEILFSVFRITQKDWTENTFRYDGYVKIFDNEQHVIAARIPKTGIDNGINADFTVQNIIPYDAG